MNVSLDYLHFITNPHRIANACWKEAVSIGDTLTITVPLGNKVDDAGWRPGEWVEGFPFNTFFLTPFLREVSQSDGRPEPVDTMVTEKDGILTGSIVKTEFKPLEYNFP